MLPGGWLFPGMNPTHPLTARQLNRAVHAAAEAAGIDKRVDVRYGLGPRFPPSRLVRHLPSGRRRVIDPRQSPGRYLTTLNSCGPCRLNGELTLPARFQSSKCRARIGMDGRSQGISVMVPCLPSNDLAFKESNVRFVRHRNGSSGPLPTYSGRNCPPVSRR